MELEEDGRDFRVISHLLTVLVKDAVDVVASALQGRCLGTRKDESDEGRVRRPREGALTT